MAVQEGGTGSGQVGRGEEIEERVRTKCQVLLSEHLWGCEGKRSGCKKTCDCLRDEPLVSGTG